MVCPLCHKGAVPRSHLKPKHVILDHLRRLHAGCWWPGKGGRAVFLCACAPHWLPAGWAQAEAGHLNPSASAFLLVAVFREANLCCLIYETRKALLAIIPVF